MTVQIGNPWTLPLASVEAALDLVGGKGATLMRLATRGFPVPPGFLITTEAYRRFVTDNHLQAMIDEALRGVDGGDPTALDRAATTISEAFTRGMVPQAIAAAVQRAYAELGEPESAVAVRSSATAEDLPELSFAGQQETFLDVRGDIAAARRRSPCLGVALDRAGDRLPSADGRRSRAGRYGHSSPGHGAGQGFRRALHGEPDNRESQRARDRSRVRSR